MIKIHVVVDSLKWKKKIKEFTVFLTNNSKMKNLNKKYRKINKPTDVLSFPLNIKIKSKIYLGDIAISYEIVNKRSYNSSFVYELDKMWIHGYLHLSGYDHIKNLDFEKMYKKENLIFKQLNS